MFQWREIESIGDRVAQAEAGRFPADFASAEPPYADSLARLNHQVWKDGSGICAGWQDFLTPKNSKADEVLMLTINNLWFLPPTS